MQGEGRLVGNIMKYFGENEFLLFLIGTESRDERRTL